MRSGLELFKSGEYDQALGKFLDLSDHSPASLYRGSTLFWIANCHIALNNLDTAEESLKVFVEEYEGHPLHLEGKYHWGRLLFLKGAYTSSIEYYHDFMQEDPDSEFEGNALFWIAESLFQLGHYAEAERFYSRVVEEYPYSFKLESAKYRLSLIDISKREKVLLDLLKLSHEEHLSALELFKRRERSYQQAIVAYQRQLAGNSSEDSVDPLSSIRESLLRLRDEYYELLPDMEGE